MTGSDPALLSVSDRDSGIVRQFSRCAEDFRMGGVEVPRAMGRGEGP